MQDWGPPLSQIKGPYDRPSKQDLGSECDIQEQFKLQVDRKRDTNCNLKKCIFYNVGAFYKEQATYTLTPLPTPIRPRINGSVRVRVAPARVNELLKYHKSSIRFVTVTCCLF